MCETEWRILCPRFTVPGLESVNYAEIWVFVYDVLIVELSLWVWGNGGLVLYDKQAC